MIILINFTESNYLYVVVQDVFKIGMEQKTMHNSPSGFIEVGNLVMKSLAFVSGNLELNKKKTVLTNTSKN